MKLGCALLFVMDFARMREFYEKMLGAKPVNTEWTETWALFDLGGAEFALLAIPEEAARNIKLTSPPTPREQSPVKLVFTVNDVVTERARLEAMGVPMLPREWQKPEEACDGVDPEGNVFQIAALKRWSSLAGR